MAVHWSYRIDSEGKFIGVLRMFGVEGTAIRYNTHTEMIFTIPFPVYEQADGNNGPSREARMVPKIREVFVGDSHFKDAMARTEIVLHDVLLMVLERRKTGRPPIMRVRKASYQENAPTYVAHRDKIKLKDK